VGFKLDSFCPVPKPDFKRRTPTRKTRGEFSPKVRKAILERDNYSCVRCNRLAQHIHHITFRSQLGKGTKDNGCSLCIDCHSFAHESREGREYFEKWREQTLDENGDYKGGF
jgi:5-methylcytosine-specific restriction endonuclease McrA